MRYNLPIIKGPFCKTTVCKLDFHKTENTNRVLSTYLEKTVFVDENVGWLQIAMNDVSGMNEFQRAENLIDEKPKMFLRQSLDIKDEIQDSLR